MPTISISKSSRPKPTRAPARASGVEPVARVLRQFRSVFNAARPHFQQVERMTGVGGAQVWALSVIQAQPDIGVGGLARAMDIHQSTASNLVRAMVASGLALACRDAADRRAKRLRLSPLGAKVLLKAPGTFSGLSDALAALDDDTLARLDQALSHLSVQLQRGQCAVGIPSMGPDDPAGLPIPRRTRRSSGVG